MAPPRQRTTAVDDSRSEASSGTREYPKSNKRRPAAAKEKVSVTSAPVIEQQVEEQPQVCTPSEKKSDSSFATLLYTHTKNRTQPTNILHKALLDRPPTRNPPLLSPRPQTPNTLRLLKRLLPHDPLARHRSPLPNLPGCPPCPEPQPEPQPEPHSQPKPQ
jgi:hypothetical protein